MGKNKQNKKLEAKPVAPAAQEGAAPAANPEAWLDTLTPEERAAEEKKVQERQRKAQDAQRQQLRQNEYKAQKNEEWAKQERAKEREEKKWKSDLAKAEERAKKEGVVEAYEYPDQTWWADLGRGIWKECQGKCFCTLCEKHLNEHTLQAHIDSAAHVKKVQWAGGNESILPAAASSPAASSAPVAPSAPWPLCCQPAASQRGLEDWEELAPEGFIRCKPCGKVVDENHVATQDHQNRVQRWREQNELEKSGYPPPKLPYLAWVPMDGGEGERGLRCLLCQKWCQDETSHSGTREQPAGSKDHQKNLRNYGPGDAWYDKEVAQVRLQYHPAPVKRPKAPLPAAPKPVLPWGWVEHIDEKSGMPYYHHPQSGKTQWELPTAPLPPASPPAAEPAPAAAPLQQEEDQEC